jgi:WD40 repeat protein
MSYDAMKIWRIRNGHGELVKVIYLNGYVPQITLLFNGNIACGVEDGTIQIWNVDKEVMVRRLCDHTDQVEHMIELSNGHLASSSRGWSVKVWNVENGRLLNTFYLGLRVRWHGFIALPQELFAATKQEHSETICLFNSNTGELVKSLNGHWKEIFCLILLDEFHMASSSSDYTVKIWNVANGQLIKSLYSSLYQQLFLFEDGVLAASCYIYSRKLTRIELCKWKSFYKQSRSME